MGYIAALKITELRHESALPQAEAGEGARREDVAEEQEGEEGGRLVDDRRAPQELLEGVSSTPGALSKRLITFRRHFLRYYATIMNRKRDTITNALARAH